MPFLCVIYAKKDLHELLDEFNKIHGDSYSYEKMIFHGVQKKVEIICKTHGSFWQRPHDHKNGSGCPKCIGKSIAEIIATASVIHRNKFNYDSTIIIKKNRRKWLEKISCPLHGYINISVDNHLAGHGCVKCSYSNRKSTSIMERISQATAVHGNKYDYNSILHTKSHDKVTISCSVHGDFEQSWSNHIYGKQGCKLCNYVPGRYTEDYFAMYPERKILDAVLYVIKMQDKSEAFYKIGITKNYKERMRKIPYDKEQIIILHGKLYEMFTKEQYFLKNFGYKNRFIPSIKFGGDKECFILPIEQILEQLT